MKRFFLGLLFAVPAWAGELTVSCEKARYFEGESVRCTALAAPAEAESRDPELQGRWTILGKEMHKELRLVPGGARQETFSFSAPTALRAVTPLQFEAEWRSGTLGRRSARLGLFTRKASASVSVFPKDPKYWEGRDEFTGRTIAVEAEAAEICTELDALGIPHFLKNHEALNALKRADFVITKQTIEGLDRKDFWSRWELVQRLRKGLEAQRNPVASRSNL